jgi:cytochrome b pre-mRNA-processing protein 3
MLGRFLESDKSAMAARGLYNGLVARAREPIFHTQFAVADTIDGRFDLLTLHAFALLEALKSSGPVGAKLSTTLASLIFAGFDDALRELGVGDFGISRRMKAMADAFYGRLRAYGTAGSEAALADATIRNLYRGDDMRRREAGMLAHYIGVTRQALLAQTGALLQGRCDFGPLPEFRAVMTLSDAPYSAALDLGLVPERGKELVLTPSESERATISGWLEIEALESLKATILITRLAENEYSYAANFDADVVQACVVTLAPVRAHLSGEVQRSFRVRPRSSASRRKKPAPEPQAMDISVLDEDGPELLDSPIIDLAAPLLEELSLALDPYPRAPGVVFQPPAEVVAPAHHPFAVLEQLKGAVSAPAEPVRPQIVPGPKSSQKKRG